MPFNKQKISAAMGLSGFDRWRPAVDVPHLVRPRLRPDDLPGEGRQAAVMVLLFPDGLDFHSDTNLVLTRRHDHLTNHAGQISLPGGRQEEGESLIRTALRESTEEIGVLAEKIEVLGKLNQVYVPPTDFTVVPFVGWHDDPPEFIRSESEVAEIIETSLEHLLRPETLVHGTINTEDGTELLVPYYQVEDHRVWGATAIILSELIERLRQVS